MRSRCLHHLLIALAILAAQWAGLAHSIEHRQHLHPAQQGSEHAGEHSGSPADLLHSCLLFDGLTTAHAAVSTPPANWAVPLLAQLGTQTTAIAAPRNTLFAQRVRVRDPPRFS